MCKAVFDDHLGFSIANEASFLLVERVSSILYGGGDGTKATVVVGKDDKKKPRKYRGGNLLSVLMFADEP